MKRKYLTLMLISFGVIHLSLAQEPDKKLKLHSISSVGLLNGSKGASLLLQTIFGVAYQRSFIGVGVGLDYYRYRTIPLFVDLRQEFGQGKRNLFLYGDLGYNYDWLAKGKTEGFNTVELENRFDGGLYYDAGVGYKVGFSKSDALLLSAGYSLKRLRTATGSDICPVIGPCYTSVQTYRLYLSRFVLKAGWRF